MAQGSHKLGKAKRSGGAQKRKTVQKNKKAKKGNAKVERNKGIIAVSKAINRKNERIIASKAMNAGTSFSMKDISEKGTKPMGVLCWQNLDALTDFFFLITKEKMRPSDRLLCGIRSKTKLLN